MRFSNIVERMKELSTPGGSLAIVDNYQLEWAGGFGECEHGSGRAVNTHTLFQAASISKPIFALAVMKLAEQGVLDIDVDVNDYLTSWRLPAVGDWQPKVTLRQLLSHSAGLTIHGFPGYNREVVHPSLTEILDGLEPANTNAVRVDTMPGLQFRYAGGGTTVAQLVVQDILGKPLSDIMQDLIFAPLGLEDSSYAQPLPEQHHHRAASAHIGELQVVSGKWHIYPEQAAAGLWTTPSDLARIGMAVQKAWLGEDTPLLSPNTVRQMLQPQVNDWLPMADNMGIGFFLSGKPTGYFSHSGSNEGFLCMMKMSLTDGKGFVVMFNSGQAGPMLNEVEQLVTREYTWPNYFPDISDYIGDYRVDNGLNVVVSKEETNMVIQVAEQDKMKLKHLGHGRFNTVGLNTQVLFDREGDRVVALRLAQNNRLMVAKKQ